MKRSFIILVGALLLSAHSFSQTPEQEAIKKVCLAETNAYNNFDYEAWASYHIQSADEQLCWNNPDGSFGFQTGWKEISAGMKNWFKTAQKENLKESSDNFSFFIQGNMALVSYSSNSQNADGKTTKLRHYKTLLKVKGEWKILSVQAYGYSSGK
jgi:hypothetical protein